MQKIQIGAGDQHFSGFEHNCSHKRAHQHLEVIALSVLERTETGKSDQHFYEEDTIVLIMYQCVFTFLDVNHVLHVQMDLDIPLQFHNHGKKDVFSGLIVKHSAVSMHGLKILSRMLCGTTKKSNGNNYLNRKKCELVCI